MALNICRYKTFVVFKSVTFEIFWKIKENVGDDANSVFHEDQKFFKSDTFESDKNCVTFEKIMIFMESTIGIISNTFHDFQKISKVTLLKVTKVWYL